MSAATAATDSTSTPKPTPRVRHIAWYRSPIFNRLLACLGGGIVLAIMTFPQDGSTADYYFVIRESIFAPRIVIFLLIGVLLFLFVTFRPTIVPYLTRPGFWPLASGSLGVIAAIVLMHWADQVADGKFSSVGSAVADTPGISPIASAFFGWLGWVQFAVVAIGGLLAIIFARRVVAFVIAGLSVVAGVIGVIAHAAVVHKAGGVDHSLGYAAMLIAYLVIAGAMLAAAVTESEQAQSRVFVGRVLGFRPGLPLLVTGVVLTLLGFTIATWFSPGNKNTNLVESHTLFASTDLGGIATAYLSWLGWALLVVSAAVAAAGVWLRQRALSWAGAAVGLVATILSLVTIHGMSAVGAETKFDGATGPWQNLGAGGWMATGGLFLVGAAGFVAATAPSQAAIDRTAARKAVSSDTVAGFFSAPGAARSGLMIAIALALFYPPTITAFWQQVLVTEIGISMLLAVGLNVVVGWAGLLDLGFIAFYALGSYTTAYLVGSLPFRPPHWLIMTPLLAIPFAILVCVCAGVLLGAPTLRLRGDYLAIVTLGFGEIIHLIAVNDPGGLTNGNEGVTTDAQRGTHSIPNPSIHIGPVHIDWGLNQLQYWYLLLVLLVIIILAFRRLEQSRLGRAWAAVREDEVAAQASGVNTTRVKLSAFAIGASTSGVAGVFFASQIQSFTPENFILNNSILVVAYVVFGGMGSLSGALAGAAMLTWLPEFLKFQVPPADKLMWIGFVVVLMMIFRPAGLIPAKRRKAELSHFGQDLSSETSAVPPGEGLGATA
jgi:ABC-type branched-subunit amino acid transport system permease subunit